IQLGGGGNNRTVTLIPAADQFGTTMIRIAVSDGMASSSSSFLLTVHSVNDRPVLAAISDYTINEGNTLMFTNSASDVDLPPQHLAFGLSNAPAGALVDPTSGVFTWTPSEAQGPSTNQITVTVTDDGSPNL